MTLAGHLSYIRTLDQLVDAYVRIFVFDPFRDPVIGFTLSSASLDEAIARACAGRTEDGVRFRHDQFVKEAAVQTLVSNLHQHADLINVARKFDELHSVIHAARPKGIGPGK